MRLTAAGVHDSAVLSNFHLISWFENDFGTREWLGGDARKYA
jgi:hypothetical protein